MTKKKPVRGKKASTTHARKYVPGSKPKLTPLKIVLVVLYIAVVPAIVFTVIGIAVSRIPKPAIVPEVKDGLSNNDLLLDEYRLALNKYLSELKPLFRDREFKGWASTDRLIGEYVKTARELLETDIIYYRHENQLPEAVASRLSHGLPLDDESVSGDRNETTLDRALSYYRSVCHEKIKFEALFLAGRLSGPELKKLAALKVEADAGEKTLQGRDTARLKELAERRRPAGDK
jgi:hypothetical protein